MIKNINPIFYYFGILFFFISIGFVNAEHSDALNNQDYIKLKIDNKISFNVEFEKDYNITKFDLESYFFPRSFNNSQYLNDFTTSYDGHKIIEEVDNYYLKFDYQNNLDEHNQVENSFVIESVVSRPKLGEIIKYPISKEELNKIPESYLSFSNFIDIDEDIRNQASSLAKGEGDIYLIATKVANWITSDIEYDLGSVLANPDQTSIEVFQSKQGVCKEITNLFLSMMRSLGIPGRVVTGYAYTTNDELVDYVGSNWGGHAWAEILIGDVWVPFDLTYNQYGFVDATHIVTDKHYELRSKGASINALGYGVQIESNSLNIENNFEILNTQGAIFDRGFNIKLEGPKEIKIGSYGYVKATIKNDKDYYQNLFVKFAKPNEATVLNKGKNIYTFEPNEEKEIFFKYKVDSDLQVNYKYTFPFTVYNDFIEETYEVFVMENYKFIEEEDLPNIEIIREIYSDNELDFDCNFFLENEDGLLICDVKNPNNFEINDLEVCVFTDGCETLDLKLNEVKRINFNVEHTISKLNYSYPNKSGEAYFDLRTPELAYNFSISHQSMSLNYSIENHLEGSKIKVFDNGEDVRYELLRDTKGEYYFPELTVGEHNFIVQLTYGDNIFDQKEFNVTSYEKPLSLKIKEFFKSIFSFI